MNVRCPDDKLLESLLGTDLDDRDRFRLESHLGDCTNCQTRLLKMSGSIDLVPPAPDLRAVLVEQPSDEFMQSLKVMVTQATTADMPMIGAAPGESRHDRDEAARPQVPGFELGEVIGRGGMGTVYKAVQKGLDRVVAVKVVRMSENQTELRERARRGAALLGSLDHPNIVRILHVGEAPGFVYGVLDYVEGGDLKAALRGGPWPIRKSAQFMEILARAVGYLHTKDIVHGDLKPANVLMAGPMQPLLADFGIARPLGTATDDASPGAMHGTPCYMAPEQASGLVDKISPATDVHALGIIFHELLTGRTPFDTRPRSLVLERVRSHEPDPPSVFRTGIPPAIDAICRKCMQKDPDQRYPNANDLAADIRRWIETLRA